MVLAAFLLACALGLMVFVGGIMARLSKASNDDAREPKASPEPDDVPSKTNESRARFPVDIALRNAGFEIVTRAAGREPVWKRGGVEFRESEAVLRVKSEHDSLLTLSGVYVS